MAPTLFLTANLCARDTFVLQNPYDHTTVGRLPFGGRIRSDLVGSARRARRQDIRHRNATLLFQEVSHMLGMAPLRPMIRPCN